jgi:flagellar basal-body rod protein FlgC
MSYHQAFQISAAGMAVEKMRVSVAAANLANLHAAAPNAAELYRPMQVVAQSSLGFGRAYDAASTVRDMRGVAVVPRAVAPKIVYEPGHPYADSKGQVMYPGVDQPQEMLTLTTALRAYEANVIAMNAARTMAARALEIGGQS